MTNDTDLSRTLERMRRQTTSDITLDLLDTVLESLEEVAAIKGMSTRALIRRYIGEGLREDLGDIMANRVKNATAQVLIERLESEDEVTAIMDEIRQRASVLAG